MTTPAPTPDQATPDLATPDQVNRQGAVEDVDEVVDRYLATVATRLARLGPARHAGRAPGSRFASEPQTTRTAWQKPEPWLLAAVRRARRGRRWRTV
jgi:hypothetical protein